MLDIDFSPDHVSIVFNKDNSRFASIGSYGSTINIWDSSSFALCN